MKKLLLLALGWLAGPLSAQPLKDLDGNLVVPQKPAPGLRMFVVWCSQCGSCRAVERRLHELAEEAPKGVTIYAVDPHPGDTPDRVRAFQKQHGLRFRVLMDPQGAFLRHYDLRKTTSTVLLDEAAQPVYFGRFGETDNWLAPRALQERLSGRPITRPSAEFRGCPIPGIP